MKSSDQIQVRIDTKTKEEARKILDGLGLDISSAIKLYFRQIVNVGGLPYEIRDKNGFRANKAHELRRSISEAKKTEDSFGSAKDLIKDLSE